MADETLPPTRPPDPPGSRPRDPRSGVDITVDTAPFSAGGQPAGSLAVTAVAMRFAAGSTLAGRYRLVAPLGKGGMGEVWRADDLVLGSSVALKFLPGSLAMDPLRLDRFRSEVRLARQIAHPNVCRVFDITELPADAANPPRAFISMEFVDGEDLASLLRRIGRLPAEKATDVARQLCLGLAAAHETGVIHRDLKPANIMLDGRGRVRIMDFGLAAAGPVVGSAEIVAGTPLYMAPEQLAGIDASTRTDMYALGLVLYELFTGKQAHRPHALDADRITIGDLRRLHESGTTPASMTDLVADIDPTVERVVARCLSREPASRPATPIAVAAALPGGDPLAAALAAGETPSPEMIARSGQDGAIPTRTAALLFAAAILLLTLIGSLGAWVSVLRPVPPPLSTQVLANKASELARTLGYSDAPPFDSASGFMPSLSVSLLKHITEHDQVPDRWKRLADSIPPAYSFWYRESPVALTPSSIFMGGVTLSDPPPFFVGSLSMQLDPRGRLLGFDAVPPARSDGPAVQSAEGALLPGILACFTAAGIDPAALKESAPIRAPWHASDTRRAWVGPHPRDPSQTIRVEAATERGQVTSFRVLPSWANLESERRISRDPGIGPSLFRTLDQGILVVVLVGGVALAIKTLRRGRNIDRRGAARLALLVLLTHWLGAVLSIEHLSSVLGMRTITELLAASVWLAALTWAVYIALEHWVRQQWPTMLISWARLLDGRLFSPLVGRDLLIGSVAGLALMTLVRSIMAVPWAAATFSGDPPPPPLTQGLEYIESARIATAGLVSRISNALLIGMMATFFLAFGKRLFKHDLAASAVLFLLVALMSGLEGGISILNAAIGIATALVMVGVLRQVGTLALAACYFTATSVMRIPFTTDLDAWHAGSMYGPALVLIAPAILGCFIIVRHNGSADRSRA